MAKTAAKKKPTPKKKTTKRTAAAAPPAALAPVATPVPVAAPIAAPPAAAPVMVWATSPEAAVTPPKSTVTNVIDDPSVSLQRFDLLDLQPYTQEKVYATSASRDFHLFYVGRDNVHDILKHVLSRVSVSLYLNMFGFDDDELNDILMKIALDATITMLVTLDKSQAGGKHEKALLDADRQHNLALFNTHFVTKTHVQEFVIGQSATHQISHTKGFVADGRVAGEGSTNWSGLRRRYLCRQGERRRRRLQGAKQHPVDHYRSGYDQPLFVRAGGRAYGGTETVRGSQGGRQQAPESQGRESAFGRQTCGTASRVGSALKRAA